MSQNLTPAYFPPLTKSLWFGVATSEPPVFRHVLIVDDNEFYAAQLTADLVARGAHVVHRANAADGMAELEARGHEFDAVISDIAMETELAGLNVLHKARRCGFRGHLASATTGLDTWWGFALNRLILGGLYRCNYLIPKRPIRSTGSVYWIPARRRREV